MIMRNRERMYSHSALLLTAFIFGANYWISKDLTGKIPVEALVVFRTAGAALLFWLFAKKAGDIPPAKDIVLLLTAGVIGVAVNQLFFFSGLKLSNPVNVSIIHITNPFFVVIFSRIILRGKITALRIAGIVLGFTGAAILILKGSAAGFQSAQMKGYLFILINTTAYALYLVIIKPLLKKYSTFTLLKWVYLGGALVVIPYGFGSLNQISYSSLNAGVWLSLLYIIVAVTFLAYLLSAYALRKLSPPVVSFYVYLQPLFATVIALMLKKDVLAFYQLIAAALIFTGVYLVNDRSKA